MRIHDYTRRDLLKTIGLGVAGLTVREVMSARNLSAGETSKNKPNIVLIMADDLGYECLGCYGSTSYKTPVLDELAGTGVRFEHCYAQPLCTPSRVQIMTGKYNFRNYTVFGSLDPKETTFGHIIQRSGYVTCVAGKWQLYGGGNGTSPDKAGFDEYCLWQVKDRGSRYADPTVLQDGESLKDIKGEYGPDVFCDFINNFMEHHKGKPFFVYYPMVLTHGPFEPTPDSKDWNTRKGRRNTKNFADMVAYMDKTIGRIVRKLDELGLRENTLVLFTSDNGTPRSITSKLGERIIEGGKGYTTDAGTHVPLIANWKGTAVNGKVCSDLVDFSDILPTLVDVTGTELPRNMVVDGRSFFPQLRGEKGNPRDWVFCYYHPKMKKGKWELKIFARDRRYKLYRNGQLFDIPADPLEGNPIKPGGGGKEATAARKRLQAVLDSMK